MQGQPKNQDATAWAEFNAEVARAMTLRMRMGLDEPELELESYAVQVMELPPEIVDLTLAVRRAASELEGQGEKSDRIATQLLTALALFAKDTGT